MNSAEYIGQDAIDDLKKEMKRQRVTQSELAHRIGISRAAMTMFLQRSNWQVLTLVRAAKALDCVVRLTVQPSGRIQKWLPSASTKAANAGTARRADTSTMAVAGRVVRKRTPRRSRTTARGTKRQACA